MEKRAVGNKTVLMADRIVTHYPPVRHWRSDRLPMHWVFPEGNRLPWISNRAAGPAPLDITKKFAEVCEEACLRCPAFAHIDMSRIRVTFTPSRNRSQYGLQAKLTPLRMKGGAEQSSRRGRTFRVQKFLVDETELLYLVTFVLPRFLDRPYEDKLVTIFHELYHVSERFDGDIRRHAGRYHAHSHSKCEYDEQMKRLVREYQAGKPDLSITEFLHYDYAELWKRHGGVFGTVLPRPKLIPVSTQS